MKKPKRTLLYGAGMLAMAMSVTACRRAEKNATVYGPPEYFGSDDTGSSATKPETNEDVYGPPPEQYPETNQEVYGPPPERHPEINEPVYGPPDDYLTDEAPVHATGEDDYPDADISEELVLGKGESLYGVVFTTDSPVTGFSVLSIELKDISADGKMEWLYEEEYTRDELLPGEALMIYLTFNGSIPNNGISYVDQNGETHYYTVALSGMDGSVQLDEF